MAFEKSSAKPVVGLGQACVDFLGQAASFPRPDEKIELPGLALQGGGPTATALVTVSRLGLPAAIIGAVGDDPFGGIIRDGLVREGVDASRLRTLSGESSQTAFIVVAPDATRTIFWHRGFERFPELEPEDFDLIRSAALLHLDGLHTGASIEGARLARDAGVPVCVDAGALRDRYLELAALSDYFICSEKFFRAFQPDGDIRSGLTRLRGLGPRHAVVTLGVRGSHGFDGRDFHHQPIYAVNAVDTTGAGDVYHGAYDFAALQGWGMKDCMRAAAAASALKCTQLGGRTGIPTLPELRKFMAADYPEP